MSTAPPPVHAASAAALIGTTIEDGRLEFVSVLGYGAYGTVLLARHVYAPPHAPQYYAVKCLTKTGLDTRQRNFQLREITLHGLAGAHPGVVTMHNVIETDTTVYVVLEYAEDGDLFAMITERQRYLGDDELIRHVFLQIIDAVAYCHELGIYHRDLKPENILCTDGGANVLLADFGLATHERASADFGCGSTFYMSPECQGGVFDRLSSYSTLRNDVWSLGVILVNLTCGRNPWKQACATDETFCAYAHDSDFLRTILPISAETNEILKRIFTLDSAQRISLADLRQLVKRVRVFTMTEDELRTAHAAAAKAAADAQAAAAAAAARVIPPPSPRNAVPTAAAREAMDQRTRRAGAADATAQRAQHAAARAAAARAVPPSAPPRRPIPPPPPSTAPSLTLDSSSSSSATYSSTRTSSPATTPPSSPNYYPAAPAAPRPTATLISAIPHRPATPPAPPTTTTTRQCKAAAHCRPSRQSSCSSASCSSSDDSGLPPTPEHGPLRGVKGAEITALDLLDGLCIAPDHKAAAPSPTRRPAPAPARQPVRVVGR